VLHGYLAKAFPPEYAARLRENLDEEELGGRGSHSFPFPLNLSLPCPFPLDLSLLCPPYDPNYPLDVFSRSST